MQSVQSLMLICGLPRLEARMLLEHVLHKPRAWLLAHDTDKVSPEAVTAFLTLAAERRQGKPMAHLLGYREFMDYRFNVSPAVLIPRPETELLVEVALNVIQNTLQPAVLDLGTGSGVVAISVALARPEAFVTATDVSSEALIVAQQNCQQLGARVQWWQGSWYEALPPEGRFDLIVSNPPYIALGDEHLHQGDLRFEPIGALTDGADGLAAIRLIIEGATQHLMPGGALWIEHGYDQSVTVQALLKDQGFVAIQSLPDLSGIPRVTGGTLSA